MNRALGALSRVLPWRRTFQVDEAVVAGGKITAELGWGFRPPATSGCSGGAGACESAEPAGTNDGVLVDPKAIETAMMRYAGQSAESFEAWADETYRFLAAKFGSDGTDFIQLGITAPPLSRALNEQAAAMRAAGRTPALRIDGVKCKVQGFAIQEGAADSENKIFGIWTPRELSHHLRAGADGPEASMTDTRYELEKLVLDVRIDAMEAYTTLQNTEESTSNPSETTELERLKQELAEVRQKLRAGGSMAIAQSERLAELTELIQSENNRSIGRAEPSAGLNDSITSELRAVNTPHIWRFESDKPRLRKGELPLWRVVNMNGALRVPRTRIRAIEPFN